MFRAVGSRVTLPNQARRRRLGNLRTQKKNMKIQRIKAEQAKKALKIYEQPDVVLKAQTSYSKAIRHVPARIRHTKAMNHKKRSNEIAQTKASYESSKSTAPVIAIQPNPAHTEGEGADAAYSQRKNYYLSAPKAKKVVRDTIVEEADELNKVHDAAKDVSRYVLGNLSPEVKNLSRKMNCKLGGIMKKYGLNEHDCNHMLEAVPDARSKYSWKHLPAEEERLAKLRSLTETLKKEDKCGGKCNGQCHLQQNNALEINLEDQETLLTSMGYSAIGPAWVQHTTPRSDNLKTMLTDLKQKEYLVSNLNDKEFPNRRLEFVTAESTTKEGIYIPQGTQDPIHDGLSGPQPGLQDRIFATNSYVAQGINEGVPMRAHVSGSAPLTLAAAHFTLNSGEKKNPQLEKHEEQTLMNLGGIIEATYDIGDYHTHAETAAGVTHFLQENTNKKQFSDKPILQDVEPKNFLDLSIDHMRAIVDKDKLPGYEKNVKALLETVETAKQERVVVMAPLNTSSYTDPFNS